MTVSFGRVSRLIDLRDLFVGQMVSPIRYGNIKFLVMDIHLQLNLPFSCRQLDDLIECMIDEIADHPNEIDAGDGAEGQGGCMDEIIEADPLL
ncbi:hypothetical protein D3C85_1566740 [compost metagenome]